MSRPTTAFHGSARKSPARPIHLRRIRSSRLFPISSSIFPLYWFRLGERTGSSSAISGAGSTRFPIDPGCKKADLALELAKVHPDLTHFYGLTFHPEFDKNRYVYVCYVRKNDVPDGSVVSRFTASRTDPPVIDPQSEQVILNFYSGGHNGGCLEFGNDGYLYISTGDAAAPSPPDVMMTGQDCSDLLSSILRIDVDHLGAWQIPIAFRPIIRL